MTSIPILSRLPLWKQSPTRLRHATRRRDSSDRRPGLHQLAQDPALLPRFVRESPVARRYLDLLGPLAWHEFPERDALTAWGAPTLPYAPFVAACLVKLDQQFAYMSQPRHYLVDHPALVWLLGFPLVPSRDYPWGFDADASLPTQRHFARLLARVPNANLQFLLDQTVCLVRAEFTSSPLTFGQTVALDTKHILAWVKENNGKAYIKEGRFAKDNQPAGDPDCRLGCKRRHNQRLPGSDSPPTPRDNPVPANTLSIGEFYWGYASGIVATHLAGWGAFVLAELTQPFDQADVSYFFPLMAMAEWRLGFRPRFAALDAAFDAAYIYDYFHQPGQDWTAGFAAIPFSERGGHGRKQFSAEGLPLCAAGLPMPLKYTFVDRSGLVEHEAGRYACPLLHPADTGGPCPANHKQWAKGGCITTLATSPGARLRHQLDRDSDLYKQVYRQRTIAERIYSQAMALGIERPRLRNGEAIANQNTLIYVLINLRGLQRVRHKKAAEPEQDPAHAETTA